MPGKSYFLQRSTNLMAGFATLVQNFPGQPEVTSYADTNAAFSNPHVFYGAGVEGTWSV